jgi:hypothetical protein
MTDKLSAPRTFKQLPAALRRASADFPANTVYERLLGYPNDTYFASFPCEGQRIGQQGRDVMISEDEKTWHLYSYSNYVLRTYPRGRL